MIFSIAMGAEYLSYVKSIATFAPTFYGYIISVLASVKPLMQTLIEILLRLSTAKYWSESHFISVRIAVLDISNDQKKL